MVGSFADIRRACLCVERNSDRERLSGAAAMTGQNATLQRAALSGRLLQGPPGPFLLRARMVPSPRAKVRAPLLQDEIVAPDTAIRSGRHVKQEPLIEQPVSLIEWLAREVKLGREELAAGPLHLEMIVPGAPRIGGRNDRVEPPTTLVIHLLMATKPEPSIVISADAI